jgi:putative inorganic carbon (HCO3(-)) transporter
MCQVSIIGYLAAGAFLTMAYYDLIYYIITILACLDKVLIRAPQKDDVPPMRLVFIERYLARRTAKKTARAAVARPRSGT